MEPVIENHPVANKPKLLDQACDHKVIRAAIHTKHFSMKTEEAYIHWIQRVRYFL